MDIVGKNILVLGLGISGVSAARAMTRLGAKVTVSDSKTSEELGTSINSLEGLDINYKLGTDDIDLNNIDLIIKSPGIPIDVPLLRKANEKGIEVVSDIELAYRISSNRFIAITGTNGKTTTTTLIGEIFKNSGNNCRVTGNIGVGILWEVVNSSPEDIFVVETSSFQLESTKYFKPKVSIIINITPDHINWHKSYENYIEAKAKIFENQDKACYTILNYDDPVVRELSKNVNSNIIFFSKDIKLEKGVYIEGDYIVINDGKEVVPIMPYKDVKIPGRHNLENCLASVSAAWVMGVDNKIIADTLKQFEGVEHRLEFVASINGINFINDSKGTNPDSSIKAVEAIEAPIVLIAGGYDKGTSFNEFIDSFRGKVKALILLGETAEKIKETAINKGFNNIFIVGGMKEAVYKAYEIAEKGDNVLLSPACASWDMYRSYEERGKNFKEVVENLRRL